MSNLLRAAVIGVGYLGRFHAQKYKALEGREDLNVKLVGVCDLNDAQAKAVGQELNVPSFTQPEQLLGQVDMVTIATITPTHYKLASQFLNANVHVNVEKPISLKCLEAGELVRLAKEKGRVLSVGHSERFNPAFVELKKHLHKPKFLELSRHAPFKLRGSDVSVIHDLMIHDLDLMLSLDSTRPRLVMAAAGKMITDTYDWANASFEFESGLKASISSSRISPVMTRTLRAVQAESQFVANLQTGDLEEVRPQKEGEKGTAIKTMNCGKGDNLLTETEHFVRAVHGLPHHSVSGEQAYRALELAEQIVSFVESHRGF
ncbi:MAG: Gfo/Idh/MocA family protein [Pseudobdellovibrionaceae bacterium]|jgi:predicted dehydrogenase